MARHWKRWPPSLFKHGKNWSYKVPPPFYGANLRCCCGGGGGGGTVPDLTWLLPAVPTRLSPKNPPKKARAHSPAGASESNQTSQGHSLPLASPAKFPRKTKKSLRPLPHPLFASPLFSFPSPPSNFAQGQVGNFLSLLSPLSRLFLVVDNGSSPRGNGR